MWVSHFPEKVTFELRVMGQLEVNNISSTKVMVRIRSRGWAQDELENLKASMAVAQ